MKASNRKNLRIFWQIAISDFKLRYNNSILGYVWTLVKPLLLFAILYVVFTNFMRFPIDNYALHLLLGIMFWNFFAEATSISMQSFINKAALITKIYFPRYLIVLAATMTSLLTLLLNMVVFFVFLFYSDLGFSALNLLLPFYIAVAYFVTLGLSFILSVAFVKFRDLQHIWEVLLQLGFWVTPVIYTVAYIPEKYQFYMLLNPIARVIEGVRDIFVFHKLPELQDIGILTLMAVLSVLIGSFIFNKSQASLAEKI